MFIKLQQRNILVPVTICSNDLLKFLSEKIRFFEPQGREGKDDAIIFKGWISLYTLNYQRR